MSNLFNNGQPGQQQPTNTGVGITLEQQLKNALTDISFAPEQISNALPEMMRSLNGAKNGLSSIVKINTDDEDAAAEIVLVKVRKTYEKFQGIRMPITEKFDNLKKLLMFFENEISTDPKKPDSLYNQKRRLRDAYATEKARLAEELRQTAIREQIKMEEITRIRGELQNAYSGLVINSLAKLQDSLLAYTNTFTLENFDEKAKFLDAKPNIKKELYESIFNVNYDASKLAPADFETVIAQCREILVYETVNSEYQQRAIPHVQFYKDELPSIKEKLEKIAAASTEEAEQLRKQKDLEAKAAAELIEQARAEETKRVAEETAAAQQAENLNTAFTAQVALQQVADPTGIRKKVKAELTCGMEEVVVTMSKVLYSIFTNPNYGGIYKRGKGGVIKSDGDGQPIVKDWVTELMAEYAAFGDIANPVPGVKLTEEIKTVQTAK